jgi:hypothetical protein
MRAAASLAGATLLALVSTAPAGAQITPTRSAFSLAIAMGSNASPAATGFDTIPSPGSGGAEPNATGAAGFAPPGTPVPPVVPGFPRGGGSFAIMTNGDSRLVIGPSSEVASVDLFGPNIRGNSDFDVTVLHITQPVTANDNCLSFELRFLTEEFPELAAVATHDTFIAELRTSDWTTSGDAVSAPSNFAFDQGGGPITVNSPGGTGVAPSRALGTVYDAATRVLRTSAPLTSVDQTAGKVELYLSIFDHGNPLIDSAVFLDNLVVDNRATCTVGAQPIDTSDPETNVGKPKRKGKKVKIKFGSAEQSATFFCLFAQPKKIEDQQFEPCESPFKAKAKSNKRYQFEVAAVDPAGNVDPEPAVAKVKKKR